MAQDLDAYADAYEDGFEFAKENELITAAFARMVAGSLRPGGVLDLGLGRGQTALTLSACADSYLCVEGSAEIIRRFRERYGAIAAAVSVTECAFEDFSTGERFGNIVMGFVLEHVGNPLSVLNRFKKLLLPGGKLFVAVPNAKSLHRRLGVAAGLMPDMFELSESDAALGHKRYFSVDSLKVLAEGCGLFAVRTRGLYLKPFTTGQIEKCAPGEDVLHALVEVGEEFPELCAAFLMELEFG